MSTTSQPASAPPSAEHSAEVALAHPLPMRVLLTVWAALMILTVLTVGVTYVDLGHFNIWMALGIALLKASLVALYFMHLRYDSPFHGIVLMTALLFVMLFVGLALLDSKHYQVNNEPPSSVLNRPA